MAEKNNVDFETLSVETGKTVSFSIPLLDPACEGKHGRQFHIHEIILNSDSQAFQFSVYPSVAQGTHPLYALSAEKGHHRIPFSPPLYYFDDDYGFPAQVHIVLENKGIPAVFHIRLVYGKIR